MQKPSVVFFNRVYPAQRGATGRVLRDLARGFARDGWQVTIIASGSDDSVEKDGPIKIIRVKAPLKRKALFSYLNVWVRMWWAGLKLEHRPDLIVTMTDPPLLVVGGDLLARAHRCRHMHWCQDLYPDVLPALGYNLSDGVMNFLKTRSRRAMKRADRVVVIGRCMARHLVRTGLEARKITFIPNWPDQELVAPDPRTRRPLSGKAAFRAANDGVAYEAAKPFDALFQDKEPKFRVLYSGTLGRAHPVASILEAAQILAKDRPEIEFVFVGDGPNFERLAGERTRRGLENIRLMSFQPAYRLRELMESGDVHLVSMREDANGFIVPSKAYAAVAVARPAILIGPAHSEIGHMLKDFQAGTVVPPGDGRKLAQAILKYRLNGDEWFAAHEGARKASRVYVPHEAIAAWISRARDVCSLPPRHKRMAQGSPVTDATAKNAATDAATDAAGAAARASSPSLTPSLRRMVA
ncbi:MAG TPA: glycosyltransferase family 4 protein [Micavibrio sp.]